MARWFSLLAAPARLVACALTLGVLSPGAGHSEALLRLHARAAPVINTSFPAITPGSTALGSWATTSQPATQGTVGDFGYTQPAIAAWDLPDYLDWNTTTALCVYARHLSGINHVDIAVQGGAFVTATFTARSPNAPEPAYCANLAPTAFATDQNWEARAIVYPNSGIPLVLQGPGRSDLRNVASLYGTANARGQLFHATYSVYTTGTDNGSCGTSGGSVGACLTPDQAMQNAERDGVAAGQDMGGATICFGPNAGMFWHADTTGSFDAAHRAVNFQPCAGVLKSQVTITSADNAHGVRVAKQHLSHVNWISQLGAPSFWNTLGLDAAIADDVTYVGRGKGLNDEFMVGGRSGTFARDVDVSKTGDGMPYALVIRPHIHDIDSDSFQGAGVVFADPSDLTSVYNVEPTYTPPGSATYVTGDTHSNDTIDNISDTSRFVPGSPLFDNPTAPTACFPGGGSTVLVTTVLAHSVKVSPFPQCTEAGAILTTQSHADINQTVELYFTATGTAGSPNITITAGTGTPFVGGLVWDSADLPTTAASPFASPHVPPFTRLLSYDPNTGAAVLSANVAVSFTSHALYTGRSNTIFYGITATNWVNSQGIFQGADMADYVLDHVTINSATLANQAAGETLYNFHSGGHWRNIIFDASSFLGMPSSSSLQAQDFLMNNTACASIAATSHTGITYVGNTSCKFP